MKCEWLKKLIFNSISNYLPNKGKRIIYVLLCYLLWSGADDDRTVRNEFIEINNRLHLSKRTRALFFAIDLAKVLFSFDDFKQLFKISRDKIKTELMLRMPTWLKYGSDEEINRDMNMVFRERYVHS